VYIEGPIARIAAAAAGASKQLRPFTSADVTQSMTEPVYRVLIRYTENAAHHPTAKHIVLMPRKTKDLEQAIQPVRESGRIQVSEAFFDRLPLGELDVVVATSADVQRYSVDMKARQRIR
jgi:hypothetical protein